MRTSWLSEVGLRGSRTILFLADRYLDDANGQNRHEMAGRAPQKRIRWDDNYQDESVHRPAWEGTYDHSHVEAVKDDSGSMEWLEANLPVEIQARDFHPHSYFSSDRRKAGGRRCPRARPKPSARVGGARRPPNP